ncbi:MAG: hypothetical protein WAW17_25255 [Rhodococcus sp. (in: high G+C Gram-positive bacteria)]|uniref:hypothetical protein n=1 Tax=Rhodococcus sp. TaxID=1831 RepID=UPI003BAE411C
MPTNTLPQQPPTPLPAPGNAVIRLVMGGEAGSPGDGDPRVDDVDLYHLDDVVMQNVRGMILGGNCDQIFLERRREPLTAFVTSGGRIAVMGHPLTHFLPGLGVWRKLQYSGPNDLAITLDEPHPVWQGIDPTDLSVRKGVSGFYARGYSEKLPADAIVTTRIGRHRLPVDYVYPLGAGEVLVHGGNDLTGWLTDSNSSASMSGQLLDWLAQP